MQPRAGQLIQLPNLKFFYDTYDTVVECCCVVLQYVVLSCIVLHCDVIVVCNIYIYIYILFVLSPYNFDVGSNASLCVLGTVHLLPSREI